MIHTTSSSRFSSATQGNLASYESYTSFGDSMLIAFYLAVMIFRICCLAADSGRKVTWREYGVLARIVEGWQVESFSNYVGLPRYGWKDGVVIPLTSDIIQIPSGRVKWLKLAVEIKRAEPKRVGDDFSYDNRSRRGGGSKSYGGSFGRGLGGYGGSGYGGKGDKGYDDYGGNYAGGYGGGSAAYYGGYRSFGSGSGSGAVGGYGGKGYGRAVGGTSGGAAAGGY
ncbi:hypothetical protein Tco_0621911 [Tanacetum coccineum]